VYDHADVVIVGSGPGGTSAALRLAQEGKSVVVVEAGQRLQRVDFSHEAQSTLSRYFWGGGLRSTRGNLVMPTLQARCLGGGSVFNSAICMRAPDFALERWNDADGLDLRNGALDPHYDRIEDFWKVKSVPPEIQGRRNELFGLACDELGWTPTPIQRNEEGCKGSGRCFTGCLNDAKQSTDIRGVPELLTLGARVYTSVHVDHLIMDGARVRGVEGYFVDPTTRQKKHRVRITAKTTILAAGAISNPIIAQRSGIDRPAIGANLRFHPGSVVMGAFEEPVEPWSGATQGVHCLDFLEEGVKLESLWAVPSLMAFRFPGVGTDLQDLLGRYKYMAPWDVWVSGEDSVGRVRALPGGRPDLTYDIHQSDVRRAQEGMAKLVEMFAAVGSTGILTGVHGIPPVLTDRRGADLLRQMTLGPGSIPLASNHVFGSMAMGGDPSKHACDPDGAVYDTDNLYVADTSLMPNTPGVNPMLTAMALADRVGATVAQAL
jgi:choline dehydrogenase-like flavoprotein